MGKRNSGTLREIGVFALGALTGTVLGGLGTPMAAQTMRTVRATRGGGDAFDELIADHERVLAALDEAARAEGPARMKLFLMVKRDLTKHSIAEEDVIYPLVRDRLNDPAEAHKLYEAHGDVKTLLAEIEEALEMNDDLLYRERVRTLRENVRQHAEEEEQQVFPRLREILDEKKSAVVAGKVGREKALIM
jgi:hemerythrin superfamily protein